jgi:hypothetical protein
VTYEDMKIMQNGDITETISSIISYNQNEQIFLVNMKNQEGKEINFLAKIEKKDDKLFLTLFDEEGGIKIELTNTSNIISWGTHHSCQYWSCVWFYILKSDLFNDPTYQKICSGALIACMADPTKLTCLPLATCGIVYIGKGLFDCRNTCVWYPCKQDCSGKDYFDSNFEYYCNGTEIWKHKYYHAYKCPDGIDYGEAGTCIIDDVNSKWRNDTFVTNCPDGCSNAECNDMVTLCNKMTTNCMSSCGKCPSKDYEYCVYSYESLCKNNNPTSGKLLPGESIPWLTCTSSQRCVLRGKPISSTTTTTTIPQITSCDKICDNRTINCALSCKKCPTTFNGKTVTYCPYSYNSVCNEVLEKHGRKTSGILLPSQSIPWLTCPSSGTCKLEGCYGQIPS